MSEHPIVAEYRRLTETLRPRFEEFHERYARHLTKEDIGFMLHKAARTFCDPFNEPTALRYSMLPTIGYSLQLTAGLGMSFNKGTLDVMLITLPARSAENPLYNWLGMPLILRIGGEPTMLLPGEELVPHDEDTHAEGRRERALREIADNIPDVPEIMLCDMPGFKNPDVVHDTALPLAPGPDTVVNSSNYQVTEFIGGRVVVILPGKCQEFPTFHGEADDKDTHAEWLRLNEESDE